MQTILYAQGASGTCSTVSNPLTYEQSSGILMLNSYGTTAPNTTQPPKIVGQTSRERPLRNRGVRSHVINQAACDATTSISRTTPGTAR